jgi:hypothetical protein
VNLARRAAAAGKRRFIFISSIGSAIPAAVMPAGLAGRRFQFSDGDLPAVEVAQGLQDHEAGPSAELPQLQRLKEARPSTA